MLTAKVRQSVSPYAWNSGSTAYTVSSPSRRPGTQARPCAALARRLRWVSTAPLGSPVVPPVYWSNATSPASGAGCPAGSGPAAATRSDQARAPGAGAVIAARAARTFGSGARSAHRLSRGSAAVRSTATTVRTAPRPATSGATLSHTIATPAPWSVSCRSSSSAV